MQEVQTIALTPLIRLVCKFNIMRRLVAILEWLRLLPTLGERMQIEQIRAI